MTTTFFHDLITIKIKPLCLQSLLRTPLLHTHANDAGLQGFIFSAMGFIQLTEDKMRKMYLHHVEFICSDQWKFIITESFKQIFNISTSHI